MRTSIRHNLRSLTVRAGFVLSAALCVLTTPVRAVQVQVAMDQVHWSLESDHFVCKLELPLKNHGALTFLHTAGESLTLRYRPTGALPASVEVASTTAPWLADARSRFEPLERGHRSFDAGPETARSLMGALDEGLWTLLRTDEQELLIPTIRWHERAPGFRTCEQELSPLSIRQGRDHALHYRQGQQALTGAQLDQLEKLARYITLDSQVTRVLVDAHTDSSGDRISNLQISRERAADVAAVLRAGGVASARIEERAHGQRYPSANNNTVDGRNLNRRVTIRVIRKETKERP